MISSRSSPRLLYFSFFLHRRCRCVLVLLMIMLLNADRVCVFVLVDAERLSCKRIYSVFPLMFFCGQLLAPQLSGGGLRLPQLRFCTPFYLISHLLFGIACFFFSFSVLTFIGYLQLPLPCCVDMGGSGSGFSVP